jgi:hypothetical protein
MSIKMYLPMTSLLLLLKFFDYSTNSQVLVFFAEISYRSDYENIQ